MSEESSAGTVHVLLQQESQYIETSTDTHSTSSMVLVDVFATEEDARRTLEENVREPLHRAYEIEEREVRSFDD